MINVRNAKKKRLEKKREGFIVLKRKKLEEKEEGELDDEILAISLRIEIEKRVAEKEKERN